MYVRKEKTFKLLIFSNGRYYIYSLNKSTILDLYTVKYILFWLNINHIIIPKYKNAQIWQAKLCFIFLQS